MAALFDRLFGGWTPHDIGMFSIALFIVFEIFAYSVIVGLINRHRRAENDRRYYSDNYDYSGDLYDIPLDMFDYEEPEHVSGRKNI